MKILFQKFSLKKMGAMLFVFIGAVSIWIGLGYQKQPETSSLPTLYEEKFSEEVSEIKQEVVLEKVKKTEKTEDKEREVDEKSEDEKSEDEDTNSNEEKTPRTDLENYQLALQEKDALVCEKIKDSALLIQCRDSLIFSASLEQKSVSGCEEISDTTKKQSCKDSVLFQQIKETGLYEKCEEIKSSLLKKQCKHLEEKKFLSSAQKKSDCAKISDETLKSQCTRRFLTPEDFKFSPFRCDEIPESPEKLFCQKMTISSSLERGKKISCSVFSGEVLEYCILKKTEISDRDLYKKAQETVRYQYCNQISDKTLREECATVVIYNSAWERKDIQLCGLISNSEQEERCKDEQGSRLNSFFYRQAKLDYDKSLCLKIHDSDIQEKCIGFFK